MALTATASKQANIKYFVMSNPGAIEEVFTSLVEQLHPQRTSVGRTIIYCRNYESCSTIYLFFKSTLGSEMTEPVGVLDLQDFGL